MRECKDMKRTRIVSAALFLLILAFYSTGCSDKFFDPGQVGRFRPVPAVNVILDSLGVAEETPPAWETGEEPKPVDVMAYETDYVLGSGDIIRISIFELLQQGVPFVNDYVITETGKISITEVGVIDAAGLTESQLEEELKQILSPGILKDPAVSAILLRSEQRTYSIQGNGVPRPSRYEIPRYDFRLLDALALSGGISQFNTSYVYVSRQITGQEEISEQEFAEPLKPQVIEPAGQQGAKPVDLQKLIKPEQEMIEIIAPRASGQWHENKIIITLAEMVTDKELAEAALPEGFELPVTNLQDENKLDNQYAEQAEQVIIDKPINEVNAGRIEWIFRDGRWVPLQVGRRRPAEPVDKIELKKVFEPLRGKERMDFGWDQLESGGQKTRVIKVPADKLLGGDPRYNIIVRPGDNIHVPLDIMGEFYIMGNTTHQGFINLTGRPMTLKMAIAAAGGLGPLAWPKRCEVTRRISKNKEETVMVDLNKIASGEQPDFFIKPNDLINVGTHPTAIWRAVLRNSFRATYGFGFIYDRNFADRDYYTSRPIPSFLTGLFN